MDRQKITFPSHNVMYQWTHTFGNWILSDPLLTQNEELWPALHKLFHVEHNLM